MDDAEYLVEVGLRIKAWRVRRRIGQDGLASRSGVSRVTLGAVERGEHASTLLTYLKIARGLGIPVTDLLSEEEPKWR